VIHARGAYAEAEPLYRRALAIQERVLGPDHPMTAETVNSIGALYFDLGEYERAEPLFRRHLEIFEKALGPSGNRTAIALGNLGDCLLMQGRYQEADELFERVVGEGETSSLG
jgi:tetratricopeptide (TPR) repeat protein